jgi:hypothetical protein
LLWLFLRQDLALCRGWPESWSSSLCFSVVGMTHVCHCIQPLVEMWSCLFAQVGLESPSLPISVSWVSRITGRSYLPQLLLSQLSHCEASHTLLTPSLAPWCIPWWDSRQDGPGSCFME